MKPIEMQELRDLKNDALIPFEEKEKEKSIVRESLRKSVSSSQIQREEYMGMALAVVSAFFQALGVFWTKIIQGLYPTKFHTVPFLFLRSFTIMSIAIFHTWYCGLTIIRPKDLPLKKWFFYRTNSNFFGMSFFTMSLWYLRASTAQIINSINPILVLILSFFILKEKFYNRYFIGIVMCISGSLLIISNEAKNKKNSNKEDVNYSFADTLKGVGFGTVALVNTAFVILANKVLASNKVPINNQMFYVGVCTSTYSAIFVLFFGGVELDPGYLITCCIHGIFFYAMNYSYNIALQKAPVSKLIIISYLQIVFVFVLGFLFLHEPIYFTDLLGAVLMLSYMIYNAYYPVKDKK